MSHFKTVCQICQKVINQCRCMDKNKPITYVTCASCERKLTAPIDETLPLVEAIKIWKEKEL